MAKALITTVPFGVNNRLPLDLLENAGVEYLINPHKKKLVEVYTYYENGKLQSKTSYKNKRRNGPYVEYYENDKKLKQGQFKNGKFVE